MCKFPLKGDGVKEAREVELKVFEGGFYPAVYFRRHVTLYLGTIATLCKKKDEKHILRKLIRM